MIYTDMRAHARRLARDPSGAVADADVLVIAQDVYTAYWTTFIRDRVTLQSGFVVFAANQYVVEAAVAARDVLSLVKSVAHPHAHNSNPVGLIERDEFEAVVRDTEENTALNGQVGTPLRWGMRMKTDNSKPLIAIFPASTGITLAAHINAVMNTLSTVSPGGDLQGDDEDGFAVARLVACEIMAINGEDDADIQRTFNLLDQKIQDKFRGVVGRARPRTYEGKPQ